MENVNAQAALIISFFSAIFIIIGLVTVVRTIQNASIAHGILFVHNLFRVCLKLT